MSEIVTALNSIHIALLGIMIELAGIVFTLIVRNNHD